MTRAAFDGTAQVATGSVATHALAAYLVRVADGRLRLAVPGAAGAVLDVPLSRVGARPLGRAGAAVVEVDGSSLLVDFAQRDGVSASAGGAAGAGRAAATARRLGPALRGRWVRGRFLSATSHRRR